MHELTIALNLLNIVYQTVQSDDLNKIKVIEIYSGKMNNIMNESLMFCFNSFIDNTPLANALLKIVETPVLFKCSNCGNELESEQYKFNCPLCGTNSIEITSGNELYISNIYLE